MTADYHTHSCFSGDSDTPSEENVKKALEEGLSMLCFTEHLDADYPYTDVSMELDVPAYTREIQRLQEIYRSQIEIRIGAELGLQPHLGDFYRDWAKQFPFDFLIGSTHLVDRLDPYYPDYWEGRDPDESIRRYLEVTLENIRSCDTFDVYGHIDYIIRYVPRDDRHFDYAAYADLVDEILKLLIQRGKGIEVNTGGFKAGLGVPNPCSEVIRRYRELGGEIITLGSDAHTPYYIGFRFDDAKEILRECGFRYFTVFRERRPEFVSL